MHRIDVPFLYRIRHHGLARRAGFLQQFPFQLVGNRHFASRDFFLARTRKAKLATAQRLSGSHPHRWPEDAARHRPPLIDIAEPGRRIQRRARRIVRELLKPLLFFFRRSQHSRPLISGKLRSILGNPRLRAFFNCFRFRWVRCMQCAHPSFQPLGVQRVDGKRSMTALRTSRAARQPLARAPRRFGQRSVHNLHELRIARGQSHVHRIAKTRPR
jgi:hypothetical protein